MENKEIAVLWGGKKTLLIVNQIFYNGQQKYGREFFTNQDEMIRYFGWDVLVRARMDIADMPDAYETHTVFSIKAQ